MLTLNPIYVIKSLSLIVAGLRHYQATERATDSYPESLEDRYGTLDLTGLDVSQPIKLLDIFFEQNVREDLNLKQPELFDPVEEDPHSKQSEEDRPLNPDRSSEPVTKVLKENCRCAVILGGPGSGKSTLMQYLALDWAGKQTGQSTLVQYSPWDWTGEHAKQFPVLIELGEYAKDRMPSESFLEFWYRGLGAVWKFDANRLQESFKKEPHLVMFDGLDEIAVGVASPLENRQLYRDIVNKIVDFADQYPAAQIIVTSRLGGYNSERLRNAKFRHFILQDLSRFQISDFVDKWCKLLFEKDADRQQLKERLNRAFEDSTAIQNLANNPQILTMMAIILSHHGSLPSEGELYYLASRVRLNDSDLRERIDAIDRQQKEAILGLIACEMQFGYFGLGGNSIDDESLKDLLTSYLDRKLFKDPRAMALRTIEQLQSDNFLLYVPAISRAENPDGDTYSFVHRKFLGYFCAAEIARRFKSRQTITFERLRDTIFGQYWRSDNRHRSLTLICGLVEPEIAGKLIEFLISQRVDRIDFLDREDRATNEAFKHLQLAGECLAKVRHHHSVFAIAIRLKQQIEYEIDFPSGILLSFGAAKLLMNAIAKYYGILPDTNSITEYYRTKSDTLSWFKVRALQDRDKSIRMAAIQSIIEYYCRKPDTLNWLEESAFVSLYEDVRSTMVASITKHYSQKPEILILLKNTTFNDLHESVRRSTVESIAKHYNMAEDTLSWLKDIGFNDAHELVRRSIVESIAKYYNTAEDTLVWLKQIAFGDRHELVRRAAVESIAKYHHRVEEILNWLKYTAFGDRHELVRYSAVESIAKYYHGAEDTLNWLKYIAFGDLNELVRGMVIKSIVKYCCLDCNLLIQTQSRALYDQNESNRREAVRLLIEYSDTLNWLKDFAFKDPTERVQRTIVRSIAECYHSLPDTLKWLQATTLNPLKHPNVRSATVWALAQSLGHDNERKTTIWIEQYALNDANELVRRAAIQSLSKYHRISATIERNSSIGFKFDPSDRVSDSTQSNRSKSNNFSPSNSCTDTWTLLQDRALNDLHQSVRSSVVRSIAKYYQAKSNTWTLLQDRALYDTHQSVRRAAVESLAKYNRTDLNTLKVLQDRAFNDPHKDVRGSAMESIAKYYPNNLNWLQANAFKDPEDSVAKKVVQAIAEYYPRTTETLNWLQTYPFNTPAQNISIHLVAVESIAKYYRTEPNTLNWLKQVVFKNIDRLVRQAVVKSIAKHYRTEPTVLNWLKHEAFADLDESVRRTAVWSISEYFGRSADVFELFCQVAEGDPAKSRTTDLGSRKIALKVLRDYYIDRSETTQLWLRATEDPDSSLRKWAENELEKREETSLI
jgi:HEAT repeat protein